MFCNRCGKEIADEAVVCVGCGCPVTPMKPVKIPKGKWSTWAMVGLVICTLLIPLVGIIFGIIGLNNEERKSQGWTLLAISIIMMVGSLAVIASA